MALWCQTVMSRVQGNTINTMARISLLFGISKIGYLARHYLGTKRDDDKLVSKGQKSGQCGEGPTDVFVWIFYEERWVNSGAYNAWWFNVGTSGEHSVLRS